MIDRVVRWFVAEPAVAETAPGPRVAPEAPGGWLAPGPRPPASLVVVLSAPACAPAAGVAVALALAAQHGGPAVLCRWPPPAGGPAHVAAEGDPRPGPAPGLAVPAARRAARRLAGRGIPAATRGRLALVQLPADAGEAAARAGRVSGCGLPTAVVLGAPLEPAFDALLTAADRAVVATAPEASPALVDLALADAARRAAATAHLSVAAGTANALAASGLAVGPSLRAAAAEALR